MVAPTTTSDASAARRRYLLFAGAIAVLAVLATLLLARLASSVQGGGVVDARFSSPRVSSLRSPAVQRLRLTLVVAPVISPRDSYPAWVALATCLGQKLNCAVHVIQRRTYEEVNQVLERQQAQIGQICSGPYVRLRRRGVLQLLVVPRVRGTTESHSLILVRADSPIRTVEELKGHSFAFTDPESSTGWLYPTYLLQEMGEDPARFFSRTLFTYGHDRSILSVTNRLVDGAAVDSVVYGQVREQRPELGIQVRVIHSSPAFGINPIVVRSSLPLDLVEELRRAFLALGASEEEQAILQGLGVERFEPGDLESYRSIEVMLDAVEQ